MNNYLFTDENFVRTLSNSEHVYNSDWNKIQLEFKEYDDWNYQGWILVSDNANQVNEIFCDNYNISNINWIWNFTNLETLESIGNYLKVIPDELINLKDLKHLILSDNFIEKIPDEIENLTNLKQLLLNYNKITKIPEKIGNLTNLRVLEIWYNKKLEELPKTLTNLNNLIVLDLAGSSLLWELATYHDPFSKSKTAIVVDLDWDWITDANMVVKWNWKTITIKIE